MGLTAAQLAVRIGADIAELQKGLKQASGDVKGFAKTGSQDLAGLGQAMTSLSPQASMIAQAMRFGVAGGAVFMGVQVAGATVEFARMGAGIERLSDSFSLLYGDSGALGKLHAATRGAVSDADLMLAANRASLLGVGKDVDELGQLWAVAIARGAGVGKSALESVNAVTAGIGRNSAQILDDIAITGLGEASYARYAAAIGKTADQLTRLEQQQALVNDIIALGGSGGGSSSAIAQTALGFERIDAAIANIKARGALEITDLLGPSIIGLSILLSEQTEEDLARTTRSYDEFLARLGEQTKKVNEVVGEKPNYFQDYYTSGKLPPDMMAEGAERGVEVMRRLTQAQVESIQAQERLNAVIAEFPPYDVERMNADFVQLEQQQHNVAAAFWSWVGGLPGQIMQVVGAVQALDQEIASVQGQISGRVAGLVAKGEVSPEQAKRWLTEYYEGYDRINSLVGISEQERQWQLDMYRANWNETLTGISRGFTGVGSSASAVFDTMRSDIESIFQPTQTADFTNQLDQMGMHIDTWDEQARRMADVANRGMDSPWAKILNIPPEVAAQGNDAVKAFAVQWQQAFYAGMMPKQIGWQAVVDAYRTQLTNRANWAQIFADAEKAIRDQGLVFDKALLQDTLSGATGGAAGAGAGAGTTITAGMPAAFNANPISTMIKTAFDADMQKQGKETLRLIGFGVGNAIIDGVNGALRNSNFLQRWAKIIAPEVAEYMESQNTRRSDGSR